MSRIGNISKSLSVKPSAYIPQATDGSWYSLSNASNAYSFVTGSGSSSYCGVVLTRGAGAYTYVYFTFDTSAIPADATIDSVTGQVKLSISNATATNVASKGAKMCSGTTEKTATVSVTTTAAVRTFTMGTWTRAELNDLRLKVYATRGESNTSSNYTLRIYGATIVINYTCQGTLYTVTVTSNTADIAVSPASQEVEAGTNATVAITGDITDAEVTDNGNDVKSSLAGTSPDYTYTILSIAADHAVAVTVAAPPAGGKIYVKQNGSWVEVSQAYAKQSGAWVPVKLHYKENGDWITT